MQTYLKNNVKEKAITVLELIVVSIVFSLFLLGVYATLDVGLKSWQLGEVKSDLHQKSERLLNRVVKEFTYSNILTVQIEHNGDPASINTYLCFETAINKDNNSFTEDCSAAGLGCPIWQGYILYYLRPDPEDGSKQNVYRCFVKRQPPSNPPSSIPPPSIQPFMLTPITNYINATSGDNVNTVVKDINSLDFYLTGNVLTTIISFKQHIRSHASVAFTPGGDSRKGTEIITMKATARANN